jgi:hypothetical protein
VLWHVQKMLPRNLPDAEDLKSASTLSDNYAPVDKMYRPVKRDEKTRGLHSY